ncbi:DUF58 domain-containing protein [Halogeometricum borinquense]|uniref:DUF58 domain-containing protein n=1 Tax=Halogeometricum borinquense TaxID=60847 RepID=A0A6C0UK97_9EURY|nr:DUF58 domain-containing protein [Halogeometricum borinquense]QIB75885.1 DUF58 domain-containing protein [Halogeometricum borinquense]QIQ75532.1 DUF58 domain-containing protein [Halogeometricum borinquense]
MRLTRRGYTVCGVVVTAIALSLGFGPRSLNAIVIPAVVALAAAILQVRRAPVPAVERTVPNDDVPDTTGTVTLSFDTERSYPATVLDSLPLGLDGDAEGETLVGDGPFSYEVTYRKRGEYELGPATIVATDVLGLVERELLAPGTDSVLVFPRVRRLSTAARHDLWSLYDAQISPRREEFDGLREYVRGDSLRDVHWKSTAKRDDLIVKEFVAETDASSVHISAGAARTASDRMAEAAATICLTFVTSGIPVTLSTPSGVVEATAGDDRQLLEHLARADGGAVPDDAADVVITASEAATRVRYGDSETTFEMLVAETGRANGHFASGRTGRESTGVTTS